MKPSGTRRRGRLADPLTARGGYQETWTVFWLTAHFLDAAARFRELGVDLEAGGEEHTE